MMIELLAVGVLFLPPAKPERIFVPKQVRAAILRVAVDRQIVDPREVKWLLTDPAGHGDDLKMLAARWQELGDAPFVEDGERFPDRETVNRIVEFNREYRRHLVAEGALDLPRYWEYQSAIAQTDKLYRVWDQLRDARADYCYVTAKRRALKQLRDLLGDEDYYTVRLPPPVPVWLFRER